MGTNYYVYLNDKVNSDQEPLHIGKSSGGLAFALHYIPKKAENWIQWLRILKANEHRIYDEYGRRVSFNDMINLVTKRTIRHRVEVDGFHCVKNGEGSWDMITGEFS